MNKLHFAVYEYRLVYNDERLLKRNLIVLRNEYGDIMRFTDFHNYINLGRKKYSTSISAYSGNRCYNIVKFLNYVFFGKYNVFRLTDITAQMVCDFLNDYSMCRLPEDKCVHRSKEAIDRCIAYIIDFLDCLFRSSIHFKVSPEDLYRKEKVFSKTKKCYIERKVPIFDVRYDDKYSKTIFRDIPDGAFQIIMNQIIKEHKNLLMLAALGAFAGMRPSECCNVRRHDSPLGPGILFCMANGKVEDVIIDLTEEKNLRSDLVSVGGIKKHRRQKVYRAFLESFMECYNIYMSYIVGRPYENDYGALTNNRNGKAITYDSYYKEFQDVVKESISVMLISDNPEVVNYGHLLQEHNISPHIFRHWFSVKLTLYGEDVAGLMHWRGDKSPESALTYLQNKSELEKEYCRVADEIFNYSFWKAEKIKGDIEKD